MRIIAVESLLRLCGSPVGYTCLISVCAGRKDLFKGVRNLRAISLFSGAGGLDVGFENAGFKTVFACELNSDSASTWMLNRPLNKSAMHVGDVNAQIDFVSEFDDIDVVYGGPPCQGFSVAGKMNADDPRNRLIQVFLDVVARVLPAVFVLENVKSLAVSPRWASVRNDISNTAQRIGYSVEFNICNSADYGVPENRERLILVGVREDIGLSSSFFPTLMEFRKKPPLVRDVLNCVGHFGSEVNPDTCPAKIVVAKKPVIRSSAYSGMLVNGAGRPLKLHGLSQTLTASMGGNNTPIVDQLALEDASKTNWFEWLHEGILNGSDDLPDVAPPYVRRLTVREAAAIQTFPAGYTFVGKPCSQYRQIGNAVPCRLAESVARAIKKAYFTNITA